MGPRVWVRNRIYHLYDQNGQQMGGIISEHLVARSGNRPDESHGERDGTFWDTISVQGTGNFNVDQTFTVTIAGSQFMNVSVFVRDPVKGDFGTLNIDATASVVSINGDKAFDADKMRKCKW